MYLQNSPARQKYWCKQAPWARILVFILMQGFGQQLNIHLHCTSPTLLQWVNHSLDRSNHTRCKTLGNKQTSIGSICTDPTLVHSVQYRSFTGYVSPTTQGYVVASYIGQCCFVRAAAALSCQDYAHGALCNMVMEHYAIPVLHNSE